MAGSRWPPACPTQPSTENVMKTIVAAFASVAILAGAFAASAAQTPQSSQSAGSNVDFNHLAQALRTGGYVIVVRHGATYSNQADTDPFTFADVGNQRNLNDKGKQLAKAFGEAIRAAGVPVGKVYTSKFNRAYETAVLAGFDNIETTADLTEGGLVESRDKTTHVAKALRPCRPKDPAPERTET